MSDPLKDFLERGQSAQAAVDRAVAEAGLSRARRTWPGAILRTAKKPAQCDNRPRCGRLILAGHFYIDPGDANPDRAGGFGGFRYCVHCSGGEPQ